MLLMNLRASSSEKKWEERKTVFLYYPVHYVSVIVRSQSACTVHHSLSKHQSGRKAARLFYHSLSGLRNSRVISLFSSRFKPTRGAFMAIVLALTLIFTEINCQLLLLMRIFNPPPQKNQGIYFFSFLFSQLQCFSAEKVSKQSTTGSQTHTDSMLPYWSFMDFR